MAAAWDRAAPTYDQVGVDFFSVLGRNLVDDAGIQAGERVLDLGCGRGAATFPAADRVGPHGFVLASDLAPVMVDLTAREARDRGLDNVSLQVMDAQSPSLPEASYDVVLASLVIFFLPDPAAALRSWLAVLTEGGRLAITTFAGEQDPRWVWMDQVFPPHPAMLRPSADGNPFDSTERIHDLLRSAGFVEPVSTVRKMTVEFADPDQWIDWSYSTGTRARWEALPEGQLEKARAAVVGHLEPMRETYGRIPLDMEIRYTLARR